MVATTTDDAVRAATATCEEEEEDGVRRGIGDAIAERVQGISTEERLGIFRLHSLVRLGTFSHPWSLRRVCGTRNYSHLSRPMTALKNGTRPMFGMNWMLRGTTSIGSTLGYYWYRCVGPADHPGQGASREAYGMTDAYEHVLGLGID